MTFSKIYNLPVYNFTSHFVIEKNYLNIKQMKTSNHFLFPPTLLDKWWCVVIFNITFINNGLGLFVYYVEKPFIFK